MVDTQNHNSSHSRGSVRRKGETTVWQFGNARNSRPSIYRGTESIEWALADLARKTNARINSGELEGKVIEVDNVVQGCVVSYMLEGKVYKPKTTKDSPEYGTLPYRIVDKEGYWLTTPDIPEETKIHFKIPELVGQLVLSDENGVKLTPEQQNKMLITLQLKEAQHYTYEELKEIVQGKVTNETYTLAEKCDTEANQFADFIKTQKISQIDTEWSGFLDSMKQDTSEIKFSEGLVEESKPMSIDNWEKEQDKEEEKEKREKMGLKDRLKKLDDSFRF